MNFKKRRRGMMLILVLLLAAILFVLCSAYLTKQTSDQKVAQYAMQNMQAREIAYSALETVRVRLLNDGNFPPSNLDPATQNIYTFTEPVMNFAGTSEIGRYQVYCDLRWAQSPWVELRVVVVAQVDTTQSNPVRYKMTGEFYLSPGQRGQLANLIDDGTF
jgi:hypothetical protein